MAVRRDINLVALALSFALGCGGKTSQVGSGHDAGARDAATEDAPAGSDAASHSDAPAAWSPVCPGSAPAMNAPCSQDNLSCEYGCGSVLVCSTGAWSGSLENPFCPMGPNPAACPTVFAAIDASSACPDPGDTCVYASGVCECNAPFDPTPDGGASWWCGPGAGCPMPRPRIGSACVSEGQTCSYQECGAAQTCQGGVWQSGQPVGCGG